MTSLIFDKNTTPSAKSQANLVSIAAAILEKYVDEERNMEYHDEFSFRLLSFIIDQLKLLCIPEQARQYSMNIIRISFLWQLTSSSLYKKLHEFFILLSVRCVQSLSSSAAVSSGQIDVEYLAQKTQNLPLHEKIVTFIVDEVYVAQRIEYTDGAVVGLAADGFSAKQSLLSWFNLCTQIIKIWYT